MRAGWEIKKFGEACTLERSHSKGAALPYVGLEDIVGGTGEFIGSTEPKKVQSSTFRFTSEHILYGRLRPYLNKVFLPDFDGHCSTEIFPIKPSPDVDRRYLYYWLSMDTTVREINLTSTGARMPRANVDAILEFPLPLTSLSEQQRIVGILDEVFAGLAAAIVNTEENIGNARELFDSYLNSIFRNSGEGWIEKTLGDVCQFQGGSQPPKSKFSQEQKNGYVRLIQIRDYKSDKFAIYIPKSLTKKFCAADDVMIGRYGPPLFQILRGMDGAYNVALMKAIPDEQLLSKDFLFFFLKNNDILSYIIRSSSRAAGQSGINKETIEPYPIAFPSLPQQEEIVGSLRKREEECERLEANYEQKLGALADLKQSILQKAFSGELTSPPSHAIKEAAE